MIDILQPRYKDSTVLIATYKVQSGKNEIRFTKAKHLAGKIYTADGADIAKCSICNNGKIDCYEVPLSLLKLDREESC